MPLRNSLSHVCALCVVTVYSSYSRQHWLTYIFIGEYAVQSWWRMLQLLRLVHVLSLLVQRSCWLAVAGLYVKWTDLELDTPANFTHWRNWGKKAIYPILSLRWGSGLRLKPANKHPEIFSSSKIFYSFTTVLPKQNSAASSQFLFNFSQWPQRLDCDIKNTSLSLSIVLYPSRIFFKLLLVPLSTSCF